MARILVCDDEEAMRAFVSRALRSDGHVTVEAVDGAHALEVMDAEVEPFDLLVTDIRMPLMDGIALALEVSALRPDMAIVMMTGFADQRERASNLSAIVHDVVAKPFQLADIRRAAAGALQARAKRAA